MNKPILKSAQVADKEWEAIQPALNCAFTQLASLLQQVEGKFACSTMVKRKRHSSAKEKLSRKGYSHYLECTDLLKGVILVDGTQQVANVATVLSSLQKVTKVEIKRASLSNPYRGAVHIDLLLEGVQCELQVMTHFGWAVKKESNHYYKNGKPEQAAHLWQDVAEVPEVSLCA